MRLRPPWLSVLALVGLLGGGCGKPDERIEPLGHRVATQLKTDPAVASVEFGYVPSYSVDAPYEPPYLAFSVHLKSDRLDVADAKPLVRTAAEIVWQTPIELKSLIMGFFPAPSPSASAEQYTPSLFDVVVPMSPTATPRQASVSAQEFELRDLGRSLQQELQAKYGPRRTS